MPTRALRLFALTTYLAYSGIRLTWKYIYDENMRVPRNVMIYLEQFEQFKVVTYLFQYLN